MSADGPGRSSRSKRGDMAASPRDPSASVDHIRHRIRKTEEVIQSLKTDLVRTREQYQAVREERDDLKRRLSGRDVAQAERHQLMADFRLVTEERDQLIEAIEALQDESLSWMNRATELESMLVREQKKNAEAQEIILYLEAQIQELESMVRLLTEHWWLLD
jgi:chromosome segregation ATPase